MTPCVIRRLALAPHPTGWSYLGRFFGQYAPGSDFVCHDRYSFQYNGSNASHLASSTPQPPTTQQVADYLATLPSGNTLAPESQNQPVGTTNPAPTGSTSTTNIPVSPSEMPTTVVLANNVPSGSSVVDPNAPAPTQQNRAGASSRRQ
jgi:hypothetical protein